MLYVGLTEDHKGSATAFAHVVGAQVISQLSASNSRTESLADNKSGQLSRSFCFYFLIYLKTIRIVFLLESIQW